MTICLIGGAIGVRSDQREAIRLAKAHGFESVEAMSHELIKEEAGPIQELLKESGLVWGTAGLPVEFRSEDERFEDDLKKLPPIAKALQRHGVTRMNTWLMPSHAELTYLQNFERHANRLRRVAQVLGDHGLRLGLEYVGTRHLLVRGRFPFVHTLPEAQELIARIGATNVGVVLDSWHWWTAGDSVDAIRALKSEDVILVDLNDAPKGIAKEDQLDGSRELPLATGVIDVQPFLQALIDIGYDGPVRAEPFNKALNALDNEEACKVTAAAMKKAFALVGG